MPTRRVVVASRLGLHARPAAVFAQAAAQLPVEVSIAKTATDRAGASDPVDASSILGLMTLGAEHGDEVVLSAEGEGADAVLEELAALLARDLDG